MTFDVNDLRRREFAWAANGESIYLNNASTGPLPKRAVEAVAEFNDRRARPHRLSDAAQFETLARGRDLIGRLINAAPAEIALTTNTTYGINQAAFGLPFAAGDVVLTPDLEFPANVYPWMQLAEKRGVIYRRIPAKNGIPDEQSLQSALQDPAVKALSVSWVSFANGTTLDLQALGRTCRARGAYFIVDAIQGLGARTLDVKACNIDILACGCQKWLLSPWGTGFLYVRDTLVRQLDPWAVSWMAVKGSDDFTRLTDYDLTWRDDARRFEFITLPFQDFAGMNAALELFHEVGPAVAAAHVASLADQIVAWAVEQPNVELVTPAEPERRSGIVSLRPKDPAGTSARLKAAGVIHSLREGAIRLSPHFYSTAEEVAKALSMIG